MDVQLNVLPLNCMQLLELHVLITDAAVFVESLRIFLPKIWDYSYIKPTEGSVMNENQYFLKEMCKIMLSCV